MSFLSWFNEPIKRKVILLVSLLVGLCIMVLGLEEVHRHLAGKIQSALANQESRDRLGKVVLHELLRIEKKAAELTVARDAREMATAAGKINQAVAEISKALTILQLGGTFANRLAVDVDDAGQVREQIRYHPGDSASDSAKLLELTATIQHFAVLVQKLIAAAQDPSVADHPGPRQEIALLRRELDRMLPHCRQFADKLFYAARQEMGQLETASEKTRLVLFVARYGVCAAALAAALIVCLLTLKQISTTLTEKETYARHLHQSNQSVRHMLEALPVGMVLIDANRKIQHVNKTALEMLGVKDAEEMAGQSCTDFLCSIEREQCPLASGWGTTLCNETYLRSKTGIHPAVLRKAISLEINGIPMVLETFVDISERKRAEQALIEKQNDINKILEAATVGIVVVDGTDYTIVEANPTAVSMLGAPKQTILGSHCRQWICPPEVDRCPITRLGQTVDNAESELKFPNGRSIPIIKNVAMTLLNGRIHLVESFIDITRLKSAEAKVKRLNDELEQRVTERTAQLEKANQDLKSALRDLQETQSRLLQSEKMASIGQLAAGVAHEINNPVGFVKSNLHAIEEYRADLTRLVQTYENLTTCLDRSDREETFLRQHFEAVESVKEDIDFNYIMEDFENVVAESAEGLVRVAKIVADLKNFAHMDADETDWLDINAGIESTLNIVWNELKYKAEVTKELGVLPHVRCYPQRINQVIMNLLLNAGQAIREKGLVSIKTMASNGRVTITISDTGEGIRPEHLNKIFDPFFTTKEVGKGTGLGLNVVYNVVKSHKGSIDVDSTPGKGTTFSIHLPVEPDLDNPS